MPIIAQKTLLSDHDVTVLKQLRNIQDQDGINGYVSVYHNTFRLMLRKFYDHYVNPPFTISLLPYILNNELTCDDLDNFIQAIPEATEVLFQTTDMFTALSKKEFSKLIKKLLVAEKIHIQQKLKNNHTQKQTTQVIQNFKTASETEKDKEYLSLIYHFSADLNDKRAKTIAKNLALLVNNNILGPEENLPSFINSVKAYHDTHLALHRPIQPALIEENRYRAAIKVLEQTQQRVEGTYVHPLINLIKAIQDILPLGEKLTGVEGKKPTEFEKIYNIINSSSEEPTEQNIYTDYWQPLFEQCLANKKLDDEEKNSYTFFKDKYFTNRHEHTITLYKTLKSLGQNPSDLEVENAISTLSALKDKIAALPSFCSASGKMDLPGEKASRPQISEPWALSITKNIMNGLRKLHP